MGEEFAAAKSRLVWNVDSNRVFSSFLIGGLLETGPLQGKKAAHQPKTLAPAAR